MANLLVLLKMQLTTECYYKKCHQPFPNGLVEVKGRLDDGTLTWNPAKLLFHVFDTHGFPHEVLLEMLEERIGSEMTPEQVSEYNQIMKAGLEIYNEI